MLSPEKIRDISIEGLPRELRSVVKGLPVIDVRPTEQWKSAEDVAKRLVVLYALTGLAHDADSRKLLSWLDSESLTHDILKGERQYFSKAELTQQDIVRLSWNQEGLYTLGWCLGLVKELPYPDGEAALDELFAVIPPRVGVDAFLARSQLVRSKDILQQADRYFCYHWILRHPECWKENVTLNLDVVLERRRALEWVVCPMEYDDITLDT